MTLALDIVARFAASPMPQSFFDGWMQVAFEEAKHFMLVRQRLQALDADYGDMLRPMTGCGRQRTIPATI